MGNPLVLVNSLQGVKDVLVEGQGRSSAKDQLPNVQRGKLIQFIQCVVFGGKNINNTIGDVKLQTDKDGYHINQDDHIIGMALASSCSTTAVSAQTTGA